MRVLIVDDHHPTLDLMRRTLSAYGHSVCSATTVEDALDLIMVDEPHVVLSDLTLSSSGAAGQDGYALARAVRSNPSRSSVGLVAVTGNTARGALQRALDSGFDATIVKPFKLESLIERLEELGPRHSAGGRQ